MAEQLPPTGLTLAGAKKWLKANMPKYTMKKTSALINGEYEYDVRGKLNIDDNFDQKRNYRLYSAAVNDGTEEDDNIRARWEKTQGPTLTDPGTSEPTITFLQQAKSFLATEVKASRINAAELIFGDDEMQRATAVVIAGLKEKRVVIKKGADGKFVMDEYTPLSATEIAPTK